MADGVTNGEAVMAGALPLAGRTVVVTRAAAKAGALAERLHALGATPIVYPTIVHAPPADPTALDAALGRLAAGAYGWLVLTSRTAAEAVAARLGQSLGASQPRLRVAAVGPSTAAACRALLGVAPELVPERFLADELAAALGDLGGARALLPNADIARPELERRLRAAGADVERVVAYRTIPAPDDGLDMGALLAAGRVDAVTFTSGSTVRTFAAKVGPAGLAHLRRAVVACIGPSTAAACRELGLEPDVVAAVSTEEGLAEALAAHGCGNGAAPC